MQEDWCANRRRGAMKFACATAVCISFSLGCATNVAAQTVEEEAPEPPQPARIYQAACPALMDGRVKGKLLPPIKEDECGENSPLEITEIGPVALTAPVTINCRMAEALHDWIGAVDETALGLMQSRLLRVTVSTSYHCRRRNNAPDGKISEHGFTNALDITGFELENGTRLTVLDHWPPVTYEDEATSEEEAASSEDGNEEAGTDEGPLPTLAQFLRSTRDDACALFTTVLGPEANALHADHFHLDLGCHGKGCSYRICE